MTEWYLMTNSNRPHMLGGFEKDSFDEYKDDSFEEALDTEFGDTVVWYNHDMTESREIKCMVQGNLSNTFLNSLIRTVLFPIGTVKAGEYILYEGSYWLVVSYPGNNKVYEKAVVYLCQYCIRWQNSKGEIKERWVNLNSASKYAMGEKESQPMISLTNDLVMLVGYDDELMEIDEKRIFIDRNETKPTKVFKVTRNDDVLYNYGSKAGSMLSFILDRGEFNKDTDNQELRICDYKPIELFSDDDSEDNDISEDKSEILLTGNISGGRQIKVGYSRTFTAEFKDKDGNIIDDSSVPFDWEIDGLDKQFLNISYPKDNQIKIKALNYEDLIDCEFTLILKTEDNTLDKIAIEITDVY